MKKIFQNIAGFFAEVKAELGKVAFPTKDETLLTTTVVIMFVVLFSILLAFVDAVLVNIVTKVI